MVEEHSGKSDSPCKSNSILNLYLFYGILDRYTGWDGDTRIVEPAIQVIAAESLQKAREIFKKTYFGKHVFDKSGDGYGTRMPSYGGCPNLSDYYCKEVRIKNNKIMRSK